MQKMDKNRIPRDSAELLEFREKWRIPRFSRISRNAENWQPYWCLLFVFVSVFVVYQLERESAKQHDEGPAAVVGVAEHCDSTLQLSANTVRVTSVCCR